MEKDTLDLRWIFDILRRRWWILVACCLVLAVTGYYVTSWLPPVYQATTILLVQPAQDSKASEYEQLMVGSRLALSYSQILTGEPILRAVIARLDLKESPSVLARRVTAATVQDTQLIRLSAKDSSAEGAALLANTIAQSFSEYNQKVQAERYKSALQSNAEQIKSLSLTINETQAQIDVLNGQQNENDAELARLETVLANLNSNYQVLQQNYHALELNMGQQTNKVSVIEPAQIVQDETVAGPAAKITLLLDPSMVVASPTNDANATALLDTYEPIIKGEALLTKVIQKLSLQESQAQLANKIQVVALPGTQMLRIIVSNMDPAMDKTVADAIGETFIAQTQDQLSQPFRPQLASLQTQVDQLSASIQKTQEEIKTRSVNKVSTGTDLARLTGNLAVLRDNLHATQQNYDQVSLTATQNADSVLVALPAEIPDRPVDRRLVNSALAAMVGLMVAFVLIFLLEQLEDRIWTAQDASRVFGRDVLSSITKLGHREGELVGATDMYSLVAEDFRILDAKLSLINAHEPFRTMMVTSPASSEGKSVVVANLATDMVRNGKKVIVVDADLRLPRLHQLFGVNLSPGLSEHLSNREIDLPIQLAESNGVLVMPSGYVPPNPTELLYSPNLPGLLNRLSQMADIVLIDCPPVLPMADSIILAPKTDGVLLVMRSGVTKSRAVRDTIEHLRSARVRIIGTVLNGSPKRANGYRYYRRNGKGKLLDQKDKQVYTVKAA